MMTKIPIEKMHCRRVSVCLVVDSSQGTDQKNELLFESYRDLHDKWERNDEHEHIGGYVESSLHNSIVIKDHTIQWRRRSDLPIL
jgi:hypothetical protein